MPFTLTNLQPTGPVHAPLASGTSIRLSPGETSPELPDVEIVGNPRLDRLRERGVIDVRPVKPPAAKKTTPKQGE